MKLLIQGTNEYEIIHDDPEQFGHSIMIVLRDDTVFRLYERRPGVLELSADKVLHIEPRASNVVHLQSSQDSFETGK